jgi:hypothetical protein
LAVDVKWGMENRIKPDILNGDLTTAAFAVTGVNGSSVKNLGVKC